MMLKEIIDIPEGRVATVGTVALLAVFMVPVLCSREDHYNEILLLKIQTMAHFTCKQLKVKVITTKSRECYN